MEEPSVGEINDYAALPLRTFDFCGITIGGLIAKWLIQLPAMGRQFGAYTLDLDP